MSKDKFKLCNPSNISGELMEFTNCNLTVTKTNCIQSGHILNLYRLSNAAPFCENYTKFHFDIKRKRDLIRAGGVKFLVPFFKKSVLFFIKSVIFHRKVPFLANIERCPKLLGYALTILKTNYFVIALKEFNLH